MCHPEKHPLHACSKWAAFNVTQRIAHIKSKSLCSNCLAGGHATAACKSTYRCRECGQAYHTTIHQQPAAAATPINSSTVQSHQVPDALMTTAQVLLIGPRGKEVKARALIDSGAGLSLVSRRIAQLLDLPLEPSKLQFSAVQGAPCKPSNYLTSLIISPLLDREKQILCKPAVVQMVTCDLPPEPICPVTELPHLMGLQLADTTYHLPGRIDILLGADLAPQIMVKQLLAGTDSEPIAQATQFGWAISGPVTRMNSSSPPIQSFHHQIQSSEPKLDQLLFQFWKVEQEEEEELPLSVIEAKVQQHYSENVVYSASDCRYQVTLPKKPDAQPLGNSRDQAVSRYQSNEKSIIRRNIWKPFQDVIQGYLDLKHAEPVPATDPLPIQHYYLPMHAVFKESSTSTKIRVVFDGSAATTSGISLNQSLLVGPTLQPTLNNILLKFRSYPIALNADITKMHREVKLSAEDKDLHRFVWRASQNMPIQDYRMTRVTFGVSASPNLAVRTLHQTADDHGEGYPKATSHIKNSFYVDDFLGGANTIQEAISIFDDIRSILLKGGFNLCKWRTSSSEVLNHIPLELQEKCLIKDNTTPQAPSHSKALGLEWDSQKDNMSPSICVSPSYRPTKRGIISDVAKTYDILGWIAPTILTMKLLYQKLWQKGHEWDETVPSDQMEIHLQWRTELPILTQKCLPRCYSLPNHIIQNQQLHGFSDASDKAFGAVVYCTTTYSDHSPTIALVTAKTKVAKLEPPTIPRLELCGAVLLTKILTNVAAVLEISENNCHAWTDSAIVLAWLDGKPRDNPIYVANRVSFIMKNTSPQLWRHVPTAENPADCASRGMMPKQLLDHALWWNGPDWLAQEPLPVPKQPPRKIITAPIHVISRASSVALQMGRLSSNYHTTLAIAAWCLRFCNRIRYGKPESDVRSKHLTGAEITQAENWLLREAQERSFFKERRILASTDEKKKLPPSSRLLSLLPFLDDKNLLRVGGRLANSALTQSQKNPIIGDSKDPLIIKLFKHMHLVLCQCGPSLLLCATGAKLHVIGARRLSRTVCSQCVICRRKAPKFQQQLMGILPAPRVTATIAFTHTGMDFAGPFRLKMGHTRKPVVIEAHICIFICMTFKAIHLEVVSVIPT